MNNSLDIIKWKLENEEKYKEVNINLSSIKVFNAKTAWFNISFLNKVNTFKTLSQKEFLEFFPIITEFFTSDSLRNKFNGYSLCDKIILCDVVNTYNTVYKTKATFKICKPIIILKKVVDNNEGYFILIKLSNSDTIIPACLDKLLCWSTLFKKFIKTNKLL